MVYLMNLENIIVRITLLCTVSSLALSQDSEIVNCHDFAKSIDEKHGPYANAYYWYPRCLTGGYYQNVQCDFYDCFCAYLDTGLRIPNKTANLNKSFMKDLYCPWTTKQPTNLCMKPQNNYPCKETSKRFHLSAVTNECEPSENTCLGFVTEEACSSACAVKKRNRCNFPKGKGKLCDRRKPGERWYHDDEKGECRPFFYAGCGGNSNNYRDKWRCLKTCERELVTELIIQVHDTKYIVSLPTWIVVEERLVPSHPNKLTPDGFKKIAGSMVEIAKYSVEDDKEEETALDKEKEKHRPKHVPKNMSRKDACSKPSDKGPCKSYHPQWYFDTEQSKCIRFIYGGCLGNENRHDSAEGCAIFCDAKIKPTEEEIFKDLFGLFGGGLFKTPPKNAKPDKPTTKPGPARIAGLSGPPPIPTPKQPTPEKNTTAIEVIGESELTYVFDD